MAIEQLKKAMVLRGGSNVGLRQQQFVTLNYCPSGHGQQEGVSDYTGGVELAVGFQ